MAFAMAIAMAMPLWRRIAAIGLCVLIFAIVVAGLWTWHPLNSRFNAKAALEKAGAYKVEIIRDNWGVPHIYGETDRDSAFGLAYAHAEDDFETIQETVAATRGVIARYRGAKAAPTDYIVALLKVWETIDERYDRDLPDRIKAYATAYADGMNLYAAHHRDETWAGLAPFTPEDVVAGFIFKTPFFYGLEGTLISLVENDPQLSLTLDASSKSLMADAQNWTVGPRTMSERGSNAFAVMPARSGDGTTRLLINSHQPLTGPVAWYEAHLVSGEGMDVTGGTFPGAPVILHGFTRDLGWANTVNKPDLVDVYQLTRHPTDPTLYQLDGEWVAFEQKTITIRVKLFGPFAIPVRRTLLFSSHGPVIDNENGTYAVRYAGAGEIGQLQQYMALNRATDIRSFIDGMALNALPSINYIYADRFGNIMFLHNGQYPDRKGDLDWSKVLPGNRSDLIWKGYRPFSDVPVLINPESGFVWNSNNTPYVATDGSDNLKPEQFSLSMGLETHMTNRALRIAELTGKGMPIDRERLLDIKFDTKFAATSEAVALIADILASYEAGEWQQDWSDMPVYDEAIMHLADWDFDTNIENRHAALGVLTVLPEVTEQFTRTPSPPRRVAFENAVDILINNYGTVDVAFGQVNRLVRGAIDVPVDGGPDILRAIYPAAIRDDGKLHASAGDSWIALVEWDADGRQSADIIHNFGTATLDETSPHYSDQAGLFAAKKFRKALLTREDILAHAERRYTPLEP